MVENHWTRDKSRKCHYRLVVLLVLLGREGERPSNPMSTEERLVKMMIMKRKEHIFRTNISSIDPSFKGSMIASIMYNQNPALLRNVRDSSILIPLLFFIIQPFKCLNLLTRIYLPNFVSFVKNWNLPHRYHYYTEHCSVGPTKLIGTTIARMTTTARMTGWGFLKILEDYF